MTLARRSAIYAALGAAGLLVGVGLSEPALTAIGAALLAPLVYGLATAVPSPPVIGVRAPQTRVLEGARIELEITVSAEEPLSWVEVELDIPKRLRLSAGERTRVLSLARAERRTLDYTIDCARWGAYPLATLQLRASGVLAIRTVVDVHRAESVVRVYPRVEQLRRLVAPRTTRPASGSRPAALRGEGIEFSELRPLVAGEHARRINWRASAARGRLFVSDRHPERSSEIVLFLDSLTAAETADESTLDYAVRAAAALARSYLHRRDRVGLLRFGGDLEWVLPGSSARQLYQVIDALLDSETAKTYRWRNAALIPRRVLPPHSLVVALTPLIDWRVTRALLNLRRRGFDLAVIEVEPIEFAAGERRRFGELVWRMWLLDRDATRSRFAAAGVPVARWNPHQPITAAVEALERRR